ncbi:hypothetical protein ACLMJK_007357 [Lecanora helva]
METLDLKQSPITTIRRGSLELPKSVIKDASSTLRCLSRKIQPSSKPQKTVTLSPEVKPCTPKRSLIYNLHTAYLFAAKDIKTILIPQTLFGLINAYACTQEAKTHAPSTAVSLSDILHRTPITILWISLNLIPFCIDNQRQPGSIAEDAVNKPSRPLPAKRLTAEQARTWIFTLYTTAFIFSLCVGGTSMCLALMGLGWLYNDRQMSEHGWVTRNILTALGYAAFGVGALMVAMPTSLAESTISPKTWLWVLFLAGVIATTGHLTDMADLEGDKSRGRKTAPIVLGENLVTWTICLPVAVWSVLCPWFWEVSFLGFVLPVVVGKEIVSRLLTKRTAGGYKQTFRIWNLWVAVIYFLPLLGRKL